MKKHLLFFAFLCTIFSCQQKKNEANAEATISAAPSENTALKSKPDYLSNVKYTEWEIGDQANIKPAVDFYTAWNNKDINRLAEIFSDTVTLRIPEERRQIVLNQSNIKEQLEKNRDFYQTTSTDIISALSLHDRESNEDWVMITVYNKWIEKNGKRDSLLYNDNWRIKNGKIDFLMSYEKLPTKAFLQNVDPAK